jgi:hypothetical protein
MSFLLGLIGLYLIIGTGLFVSMPDWKTATAKEALEFIVKVPFFIAYTWIEEKLKK